MVVFEENKPSMRQVLEMSALLGAGGAGDEPPGAHSRSCARRCWVLAAAEEGRAAAAEGFRAGGGEAGVLGQRCRGRAWGSGVGGRESGRQSRATRDVPVAPERLGTGRARHVGPRRLSSTASGLPSPLRTLRSPLPTGTSCAAATPALPPLAALFSRQGKQGSGVTSTQVQATNGHPLDKVSHFW